VERESADGRNYVRKAVNWALRQVGKRNLHLNRLSVETAERIMAKGDKTSKWVAADALKELNSEIVQQRLKNREKK
jgi:3-methyladenine DNA glycosylase AlkD